MDSNYQIHHQQNNQPSSSSGLLRFRSAPSSLLSNLLPCESDRFISRFVTNSTASLEDKNNKPSSSSSSCLMDSNGYGGAAAGLPPHYPRHSATVDGSFGLVGSMGRSMDHEEAATTTHKSFGSNLLRQNSSPAGLFSNMSFQNGFATMKGVGNYAGMNGSNGELNPSINRLKNQISFSSRSASSLGMLSQISEIESEDIEASSPVDERQGGSNGFPSYASWNDTPQLSPNLSGLKRGRSGNEKMFSDVQNGDIGSQVNLLSHHLSLPKTSAEMVAMEKLLQFPDSVPCKIRAKRGCATHPRSIAERVRRTRISERMRKLQELVPNMDKQTNTADMLDFAVEYIKDLQKQFKNLSEKRAKCKCISMQKADTISRN